MKKEEIVVDGQKLQVVIKLSEEFKDDNILTEDLEDTLDLGQILDDTKEIKIGDSNE